MRTQTHTTTNGGQTATTHKSLLSLARGAHTHATLGRKQNQTGSVRDFDATRAQQQGLLV